MNGGYCNGETWICSQLRIAPAQNGSHATSDSTRFNAGTASGSRRCSRTLSTARLSGCGTTARRSPPGAAPSAWNSRIHYHVDTVGGQHLDGARKGRLGQRVGVHSDEERTVNLMRVAIRADGLRDGQNMCLVEGALEGRAAVSRRSEHDARRDVLIGMLRVVHRHQPRHVDQQRRRRRLSGEGTPRRHQGRAQPCDPSALAPSASWAMATGSFGRPF